MNVKPKSFRLITRAAMTLLLSVLTTMTAWAENVQTYYIDENGTRHDVNATELTGTGLLTANQWYVVNSDVTISSGQIYSTGNIKLILADGKTFTFSSNNIDAIISTIYGTLSIYGQENGTGTLNVTANGSSGNAIYGDSGVNIVGGHITATSNGGAGIQSGGNITISGGQVSATGGSGNYGLRTFETITLGWRNPTDYVYASSYLGTVTVKDGQAFKDDSGNIYVGTLDKNQIKGKTLIPATQTEYIQYCLGTGNDGSAEHPYTISDANGWNAFCLALEDNNTWNRFSGKTVKLGADIEVSRMAGSDSHDFCGTFDGDGHTLTFNYGTAGSYASDEYAAPFHYVSNVGSTAAAFRNLHVAGHIYTSAKYASGLIAQHWGTVNVENCRVSTVIHSSVSGDGTHGGIEAVNIGVLNITGCVFDGKLLTTNGTDNCGGFVGWHNGGTTNISNSLYAPAAIATGEKEVGPGTAGQNPSATFGRNAVNSIANSYYTRTLGTAQGKQAHSITASGNATLVHAGVATEYSVSGITAYKSGDDFTSGILYDNVLYAGDGDAVSLTLTNTPPEGYVFNGYTVSPEGTTLTGSGNAYTLTMPNENVTINATLVELPEVSYIDEDGEQQQCTAYTPLDGTETSLGTADQETWYVADGTLNYSQTLTLSGDVHLILKDNAVMNVGTQSTITYGIGDGSSTASISIYGQSTGNSKGQLHVNASTFGIFAKDGNLTINGGEVVVTSSDTYGLGIFANGGNITINGGEVEATSSGSSSIGIYTMGGGNVVINGGEVVATSSADGGYGIFANGGNITINGGEVVATSSADGGYGIFANGGNITINGGEVEATGNNTNGEGIFATKNSSGNGGNISISNATVTASGCIGIDAQGGLTINSGTVTANGGLLATNCSLTINGGEVTANGSYGIHATNGNITISGGQVTANGSTYDIYAEGGNVNISGGQVTANGSTYGIYAEGGNVNISGGEVEATGNNTNGEGILAIKSSGNGGSISISNATVTATGSIGIRAKSGITINSGTVTANNCNYGIYADGSNLTINDGQVTANGNTCGIFGDNITITSGEVTANGTYGIYANNGNLTISGGTVTATGGTGIFTDSGTITLGWTNVTDFIYANSYYAKGTLSIAEGKAFINAEGDIYESGTVNASDINGKTLRPYSNSMLFLADDADNTAIISKFNDQTYNVTLAGRTLWKDGAWNTLCLPFDVTISGSVLGGDGVEVKALTSSDFAAADGTLTLNFSETSVATLTAGVPYIIRWTKPEGYEDNPSAYDLVNPVFTGVTVSSTTAATETAGSDYVDFVGTYQPASIYESDDEKHNLYLGTENKLYYPTTAGITVNAFRGYFRLKNGLTAGDPASGDPASGVRSFVLNFGDETTGIVSAEANSSLFTLHSSLSEWYTLDGRKLSGKPTRRGLYIHNGIKVVIK